MLNQIPINYKLVWDNSGEDPGFYSVFFYRNPMVGKPELDIGREKLTVAPARA